MFVISILQISIYRYVYISIYIHIYTVKSVQREVRLIFFAVESRGSASDFILAKNSENILKRKTEAF